MIQHNEENYKQVCDNSEESNTQFYDDSWAKSNKQFCDKSNKQFSDNNEGNKQFSDDNYAKSNKQFCDNSIESNKQFCDDSYAKSNKQFCDKSSKQFRDDSIKSNKQIIYDNITGGNKHSYGNMTVTNNCHIQFRSDNKESNKQFYDNSNKQFYDNSNKQFCNNSIEFNKQICDDHIGNIININKGIISRDYDSISIHGNSGEIKDGHEIWIFGYGSLCWNPGFSYNKSMIGFIKGFSRKFWQGSITHRGTKQQPGRVATLIEDNKSIVWGRVFQVTQENDVALKYLDSRECFLGGYMPLTVTVNLKEIGQTILAITFVAYSGNSFWLGEASLLDISSQIASCKGHAGHNIEYLLKLAEYMRIHIPEENDFELFALESLIKDHINEKKLSVKELIEKSSPKIIITDDNSENNNYFDIQHSSNNNEQYQICPRIQQPAGTGSSKNEFASRIPNKNLRCVNI